jgi:ketosteroid isomerase-like protein
VSGRNLEIVRQLYRAMAQPTLAETLELLTEDVEFVVPGPPGLGAAGTWRGYRGVEECLGRLRAGQRNEGVEFCEFIADGDHVVVRLRVKGRVLSTGKPFESDIVHLFTLRDGKIARLLDFFDTAALAAAFTE